MVQENKNLTGESKEQTVEQLAEINFKRFNDALASNNPENVAQLFTDDAAFHPTMSGAFKIGKAGALEYFIGFIKKHPVGMIDQENQRIKSYSPNAYTHSGKYKFEIDDGNGGRMLVDARFSYNWLRSKEGVWEIDTFHSSLEPNK